MFNTFWGWLWFIICPHYTETCNSFLHTHCTNKKKEAQSGICASYWFTETLRCILSMAVIICREDVFTTKLCYMWSHILALLSCSEMIHLSCPSCCPVHPGFPCCPRDALQKIPLIHCTPIFIASRHHVVLLKSKLAVKCCTSGSPLVSWTDFTRRCRLYSAKIISNVLISDYKYVHIVLWIWEWIWEYENVSSF